MEAISEGEARLTAEAALDPDLPTCDPHHHLRERPNDRYFLEEFTHDTGTGQLFLRGDLERLQTNQSKFLRC
jgi:hypothetical protein